MTADSREEEKIPPQAIGRSPTYMSLQDVFHFAHAFGGGLVFWQGVLVFWRDVLCLFWQVVCNFLNSLYVGIQ